MLKIAWRKEYHLPLPEGHRFPMDKYTLLPQQLLYEGTINYSNLFEPEILKDEIVLKTHTEEYLQKLKNLSLSKKEERKTGFPITSELITRELYIMNGTLQCTYYAIQNGISMNIAGGTHHAYTNHGEGFCLLNDNAIAANFLLNNKLAKKILIVDLDVHQGNGTAQIFQNNTDVFTFSMHGEKNYPMHKEKSDLDIELADGTDDKTYLHILNEAIKKCLDLHEPDFLFYQCGVDVLSTDKLGRLSLSLNGCKQRDKIVLQLAKNLSIPIVCSMGGGYSEKISDIVDAHANTFRLAQEIFF